MKIALTSFRGEVPRMTPRALPENAAQEATNCRMQTGDLESWRQFLLTKVLANSGPVQTIYKLNGAWLAWNAQVDVARGLIAGDATFRAYLTSPGLYAQPRFTNYALATTGAEPYPVTTRPLGVPAPVGDAFKPGVTPGIDPNPLTFTVPEIVDTCDALGTNWLVSAQVMGDGNTSLVRQSTVEGNPAGCFELVAQNNGGNPAYALRDFGIAKTSLATFSADGLMYDLGSNAGGFATVMFGVTKDGSGCRIMFGGTAGGDLHLFINMGSDLLSGDGGILAQAACTGALTVGTWYTITAVKTTNPDNTATVVAKLLVGGVEVGTVTATNVFDDGGYCGIIRAKGDDVLGLRFDNFRVAGSGSTGYVAVNTAVSYVYTFVNDLGEEGPPSPESDTKLRPDGISMTVVTPATLPPGTTPDYSIYGITTKRLYRAVTGASGTVFLLVVEIPLAQTDYVDVLNDNQIAGNDVLASADWDLPPDGMQGIIALPNGIMAGFWRNLLCLSEADRPHAWPVRYRKPTDTDIVGIANIDNTIVIGTKSFPYTATGNSPGTYSMSKPGDPQACVSKRSMVFMADQGVVYASPDGMMVCAGSAGQIRNATNAIFTKRQWQALDPTSMVCAVHDGVLFLFATGPTPDAGYALDTKADGFGLIRLSFHAIAAHMDPLTDALYLVLDLNSEPTSASLPLASTAVVASNKTIFEFDAGASNMVFRWRGRLNLSPYPLALTIAQVRALNYANLLVRIYGDGVMLFEKVLANAREFVLPLLDTHESYELELMGTSTTRGGQAAEDVMELS